MLKMKGEIYLIDNINEIVMAQLSGSLLQFIEEQCVQSSTAFIACQLFIDLYLIWCKTSNIDPVKILTFQHIKITM